MKSINNYILEKQSFLVKKHITDHSFIDDIIDILDENFAKCPIGDGSGAKLNPGEWKLVISTLVARYYGGDAVSIFDNNFNELKKNITDIANRYDYVTKIDGNTAITIFETNEKKWNNYLFKIANITTGTISVLVNKSFISHEDIV